MPTRLIAIRSAEFLYNPAGRGLHAHGASLLLTRGGDLLAAWYAYPEVEQDGGAIVLARRPHGATAWLPSDTPIEPLNGSAGNPVLFEEPDGRVRLLYVLLEGPYWTDAAVHSTWSDDGGRRWAPPAPVLPARGTMIRHPPARRRDGTWLLPAYEERQSRSVLLTARPPFRSWEVAYRFERSGLIQPVLVQGPRGLTLLFRPTSDPRVIWRSDSTDEGAHWSEPAPTSLPTPLSGIAALSLGSRFVVVYNHTARHERRPLNLATSDERGQSWSPPWQIDDMTGELSYPSFVSGADGTLHGVYSYNRRLIKYVEISPNAWS